MKTPSIKYFLLFTATLFCWSTLQAKEPAALFSPFPSSKIENTSIIAGEETRVVQAYFPDKEKSQKFAFKDFIGDVSHYQYVVKNVSSLAVAENYKEALKNASFVIKYECSNNSCGKKRDEHNALGKTAAFFNVYNFYRNPKYIYAEKEGDPSYVLSLFVGQHQSTTKSYLTVIKVKPVVSGLITADVSAFSQQPSNKISKPARDDVKGSVDHSLLTRYPGSYIEAYQQMDYDEVSLPSDVPSATTNEFTLLDIVGDVTHITYSIKNVSTLKIYRNYVAALTKEGFETVFACEKISCGKKRKILTQLGDLVSSDHVYNFFHHTRYQLMKNSHDGQTTYVAVYVGDHQAQTKTQLVIVRTEPLQKGLIKSNSSQVIKQLEQKGKASIYGIFFDYDKADIKPESKAALQVITEVLNNNKNLKIYVVGHTDDQGDPKYNLQLSKRRATAVVNTLVKDFNIKPSRLTAHGAGPYSPAASNRNDLGRQLNRRVELVERLAK